MTCPRVTLCSLIRNCRGMMDSWDNRSRQRIVLMSGLKLNRCHDNPVARSLRDSLGKPGYLSSKYAVMQSLCSHQVDYATLHDLSNRSAMPISWPNCSTPPCTPRASKHPIERKDRRNTIPCGTELEARVVSENTSDGSASPSRQALHSRRAKLNLSIGLSCRAQS